MFIQSALSRRGRPLCKYVVRGSRCLTLKTKQNVYLTMLTFLCRKLKIEANGEEAVTSRTPLTRQTAHRSRARFTHAHGFRRTDFSLSGALILS